MFQLPVRLLEFIVLLKSVGEDVDGLQVGCRDTRILHASAITQIGKFSNGVWITACEMPFCAGKAPSS
jgi:hypothetical protein